MKFKSKEDKLLFCTELSISYKEDTDITEDMVILLYSNRSNLIELINRDSYKLGSMLVNESISNKKTRIKSVLGKFIENTSDLDFFSKLEVLKSISSLNTHILIEMGYYHSIYEDIELKNLYGNFSVLSNNISKDLMSNKQIKLSESNKDLIISLI